MSSVEPSDSFNDIAIIGMSGRFPGAKNLARYWRNLRDGVESISFFKAEELAAAGVDPSALNSPGFVPASGVLDEVDLFDASFFGFNPREAESLDPQQRLFMECAWQALEDAGYDPEIYGGVIGVFAGCAMSTYLYLLYRNPEFVRLMGHFQILIGNDKDYLTTHTAYKLNLKGPSVTIQTACSTSLVAVCYACQSLLNQQCDMALAGGVTVRVPQKTGYYHQTDGIYSPDGHCRAFDARAQGTVFGSGLGIVVLKRLDDALADGDYIYAVIKGSAINNDGSLKVGYTAPSLDGQAEVIAMAQAVAGVEPETITYVETHGTGTALGDPIEIEALTQAFRAGTEKSNFCAIGSVKTNIGHLDPAAGVASLIKTVLALEHKMLPPSLNYERPNPGIDFANTPFYVNARLAEWKTEGPPRRAGVSAFGIGGTNAHVILEEAPPRESDDNYRTSQLLLLSARTSIALESATVNLVQHLKQNPQLNLADVAYTLQAGRRAFRHRRMALCHELNEAASALETLHPRRVLTGQAPRERSIVFMFSGQGTQYVNMALDLYRTEQTFRQQLDLCAELLQPHLCLDLREILYPPAGQEEAATRRLTQTAITQPALFAIEYSLARQLMDWGVRPKAMIGHSIGEYVAACLSGVFSLEAAFSLVAGRGRLMQQLPGGSMLAVPLAEKELQPLLNGKLSLATINEPSMCVISGPTDAVDQFEAQMAAQNVECRRLHTSHAFHSGMMEPILGSFRELVKKIDLQAPQVPYVSNLTGTWITASAATSPAYWANHLRQTVRFAAGLRALLNEEESILLEIGPGQSLSTFARRHPDKGATQVVLSTLRHPHERQSDTEFLLNTLGQLWLNGVRIDWSNFYAGERRRRVPLPTYPFERQSYWVQLPQPPASAPPPPALLKKPDIADWLYLPSWQHTDKTVVAPSLDVAGRKSRWLIFEDVCGVGAQVASSLAQSGADVMTVRAAEQFARVGDESFEINPRERRDYDALLKELRTQGKLPDRIVHLWSVTEGDSQSYSPELVDEYHERGFYSLIYLAQALGEQAFETPVQLTVVSSEMQSVSAGEPLCPLKATALGPCRIIPQEYPNIICRNIDLVVPAAGDGSMERLCAQLTSELASGKLERVVAYRGDLRWVQTFEPVRLDKPAGVAPRLREGGVYLITGGLGGVGLALAKYLAHTVRARLVLIQRSSFPERDAWEGWLKDHQPDDGVSLKIREVQEIERLGGEVLLASADVADEQQMKRAVDEALAFFGPVQGVIHAAGLAGGGIIPLKTREIAERVLAPKVRGALVLDALFQDASLDFFVLCSSLTSIVGGAGQVDYCGANAFLDAFAHSRGRGPDGRLVVSIDWDTWQETGMAVNTPVPREYEAMRQDALRRGLRSDEATEVFARILNGSAPQVVVAASLDLRAIMEPDNVGPAKSDEAAEATAASSSSPRHPRPELGVPYAPPRNELERTLLEIWQDLLGVEPIGIYDNFFTDLAGHSLLATQFVSRVRNTFQVEITLQSFFEVPTVEQLAPVIASRDGQGGGVTQEPRIVPLRREAHRGMVSAEGELKLSVEKPKEFKA